MAFDIYGDDVLGDLLDGDDDSLGFEYTEILGDDIPGHSTSFGHTSFGDDLEGEEFVEGDFVGAARRRRRINRRQAAAGQALMRKRIGAGALLRGVPPRQSREYALGLGSTSVAGNSSANINVQPQVIFRPERLVVPSNLAIDFLLTDIKVGKNSQLVSTGALPAVMFTEVAFGVRLKMDTCQISMFVTVSVTNQNPAARNFQGGIVGPAVE
jgi:hypothetical protein